MAPRSSIWNNTFGYKNYPDNVIRAFVKESADAGIDVFRIFDSLNWLKGMDVAIDETLDVYKRQESSPVGKGKSPVDASLSIGEIIELAKAKSVYAIHPGYVCLSENAEFAKHGEEAGIAFIGPTHEMMNALGDKIQSKIVATSVGVPTIPGVEMCIRDR